MARLLARCFFSSRWKLMNPGNRANRTVTVARERRPYQYAFEVHLMHEPVRGDLHLNLG
jgi:hypothetical protein